MNGLSPTPENGKTDGGIGPELMPDRGSTTFNIKVSHGHNLYGVSVPSNSTFGDLKSVIVQTIGLEPEMYKLLFRGKEKDDDEDLQTIGIKDNSKVVLMKDMTCRRTSPEKVEEEVKETSVISRGDEAVAAVREEVNMLSEQVSALQAVIDSGIQVNEKHFIYLTEMLMRQLLKLDAIEAEGEGRVQRKMEVRRVQSFVDKVDILKSENSSLFNNANNDVSSSTQSEIFEHGCESVNAAPMNMSSSPPTSEPYSTPSVSSSGPSTVPSSTKPENLERELVDVPENNGSVHQANLPAAEIRPIEDNELKKPKKTSEPTSSSDFCPQAIKLQAEQVLLKFYWDRICEKIMKTPFEELSAVKPAIDDLFLLMKKYMVDTSPLEAHLRSFFEGVSNYVQAKFESNQRGTEEVYENSLFLAQQDLFEVEALECERVNIVNGLKDELLQVNRQQEELKTRLAELIYEEEFINSSLHKAEEDLFDIQRRVANKRENIWKLVNTPCSSKQEIDALEKMEVLLEESRRDLAAFDLFA